MWSWTVWGIKVNSPFLGLVFLTVVCSVGLCSREGECWLSTGLLPLEKRRIREALGSLGWENQREATAWDVLVTLGTGGRSCSVLSLFWAALVFALLLSPSPWKTIAKYSCLFQDRRTKCKEFSSVVKA